MVTGGLASLACGITGTLVVIKRLSYMAGGIAHAVLGGLGIAYFFDIHPYIGALGFALLSAMLIGWIKFSFGQNEDTLISALWATGMSVGIIFMYLKPGYNVDLFSFLFGNILMVPKEAIYLLVGLDMLLLILFLVLYRQVIATLFDEEFASLRGIPQKGMHLLLLFMVAITVVILIWVVGLVLVIALLTLPASISALFCKTPLRMAIYTAFFSLVFIAIGLYLSYWMNLPSGATIVLVTSIVYVFALASKHILVVFRKAGYLSRGVNKHV